MDKTAKSMANDVPPGFANRPSFIAISARRPASAREALGQRPQSWVYTHAECNPTHLGAIGSLPERSFVGPGGAGTPGQFLPELGSVPPKSSTEVVPSILVTVI